MLDHDVLYRKAIVSMKLEIDGGELERTTITETIGERYPIIGRFSFPHMLGFTLVGDTIKYIQPTPEEPKTFLIGANMVIKASSPSARVHYGIIRNRDGVDLELNPELVTGLYMKTADEAYATGGLAFPIDVLQNDTYRYVLWSDQVDEEVVITHFTSYMTPTGQ